MGLGSFFQQRVDEIARHMLGARPSPRCAKANWIDRHADEVKWRKGVEREFKTVPFFCTFHVYGNSTRWQEVDSSSKSLLAISW